MLVPNDPVLQACVLGATLAFSGSPPASILGSSSVEPFSFGFSSSQAGTTVLLARCTHAPLLLDQTTFDELVFSSGDHCLHLFLGADRHCGISFQFSHGQIGD
jgi:hypothetical protein